MTESPRSRWLMLAAGASSLALLLSACSSDSDEATEGAASAAADDCANYEQYGDLSGKEVNIYASILSPELEMYEAAYVPFKECTGANMCSRAPGVRGADPGPLEAGNPPDIAFVPQPGLLASARRDTGT